MFEYDDRNDRCNVRLTIHSLRLRWPRRLHGPDPGKRIAKAYDMV